MITEEDFKKVTEAHVAGTATPQQQKDLLRVLLLQRKVLSHVFPEKTQQPFICGEGGEVNEHGMPEYFMVCPQYGCDGMYMYKRSSDYTAPGW